MSLPTAEQSLLLGGITLASVLVVLALSVLVRRARRRRDALAAEEVDRAAEAVAAPPAEPTEPVADPGPGRVPAPGRTVAEAVQRALAAREARGGDVRDRLLAVLLSDPVRAVGATVELDTCRHQLDRLTGAVQHERAALRAVLTRLAATGLSDEQVARLAQLPVDEVRDLLGDGGAGPEQVGSARDALQPR